MTKRHKIRVWLATDDDEAKRVYDGGEAMYVGTLTSRECDMLVKKIEAYLGACSFRRQAELKRAQAKAEQIAAEIQGTT